MIRNLLVMGIPISLLALAACTTPEPGVRVEYQEVVKEVLAPCPVTRPERPAPLAKPLPTAPRALIDLLTAKLLEWAGPGGYGEKADAAIETCVNGSAPPPVEA